MSSSENIVYQDAQITEILEYHKGNAASALFERYRISGVNKDAFVAALIGQLCITEARASFERGQKASAAPTATMEPCSENMEKP